MTIDQDSVTRILDIPREEVPYSLILSLNGLETYRDMVENMDEDLYGIMIREQLGYVVPEEDKALTEIEQACIEHNCSYFRFIKYS